MNTDELKLELIEFRKYHNNELPDDYYGITLDEIDDYLSSTQFLKRNELRAVDSNSKEQLKEACPRCGCEHYDIRKGFKLCARCGILLGQAV